MSQRLHLVYRKVDHLFKVLLNLKNKDKAIIFITHKLDEVFKICDEITIFRDGQLVHSNLVKNLSKKEIIKKMLGRVLRENLTKKSKVIDNRWTNILYIRQNLYKNISVHIKLDIY